MASAVRGHLAEKVLGHCEKLRSHHKSHRRKILRHEATDSPIEATPEDFEQIRLQLGTIKRMLAGLFGRAYDGGRVSLQARVRAADLIEANFDEIVEQWTNAVEQSLWPSSG